MKTPLGLALLALAFAVVLAYSRWQEGCFLAFAKSKKTGDLDFYDGEVVTASPYVAVRVDMANSGPGIEGSPTLHLTVENLYPGAVVLHKTCFVNDGEKYVEKGNFASIREVGEKGKDWRLRDVYHVKFEIVPDVDMANEKKGKTSPFRLKPGEKAVVWVQINAGAEAPEGVAVEVVFKCWGK